MRLLLDSFWRAVAYCLRPRVMLLSLLPLGLMVLLAALIGYLFWTPAVAWTREALEAWPLLASFWGWIGRFFSGDVTGTLAPLVVVLAATPLLVLVALVIVAAFMAPVAHQARERRRHERGHDHQCDEHEQGRCGQDDDQGRQGACHIT
ncbi:MAG: hypothetical protein EOO22_12430, partial [Comamonadaceae bacterium]